MIIPGDDRILLVFEQVSARKDSRGYAVTAAPRSASWRSPARATFDFDPEPPLDLDQTPPFDPADPEPIQEIDFDQSGF